MGMTCADVAIEVEHYLARFPGEASQLAPLQAFLEGERGLDHACTCPTVTAEAVVVDGEQRVLVPFSAQSYRWLPCTVEPEESSLISGAHAAIVRATRLQGIWVPSGQNPLFIDVKPAVTDRSCATFRFRFLLRVTESGPPISPSAAKWVPLASLAPTKLTKRVSDATSRPR